MKIPLTFMTSLNPKPVFSTDGIENESLYGDGDLLLTTSIPLDPSELPAITIGGWIKLSQIDSEVLDSM
jgi:hypothetical protein